MHKLLQRQLRRLYGAVDRAPAELGPLLELVSATYQQADHDRLTQERSLDLVSQELLERNRQLREDIAARIVAQEEVAAQKREFRALIQHLPVAVGIRRGQRLVFANDALTSLLGYGSAEELRARSLLQLIHPDDRRHAAVRMVLVEASGATLEPVPYRFLRRDGTVVRLELSPLRHIEFEGGPAVLLAAVDLTERDKMQARLLLADRLASIGTLAAGVAHEINNPLAFVLANLDFVGAELAAPLPDEEAREECRRALAEARHGGERVRQIVRDLKLFSRTDEEARQAVDVEEVLDSTLKMAANELRHRGRVVRQQGGVRPVFANQGRLGQVFLNLVINAAHALPERADRENEIRVVTRMEGEAVVVEVRDNGQGMAPEVQRRIFDPFFTTKPVGVGTGLGLAICHGIVTGLGGEIEVESELGVGTCVRIRLPACADAAAARPAERAAAGDQRRCRILVVDDEPMVVASVRRILAADHEIVTVTSGADAVARLREDARFDVVLCDVMMPGMTGMELHEVVKSGWPGLERRMVFITGGAFTNGARAFLDEVPNARVDKPFEARGLREMIQGMVRATSSALPVAG